MNPVQKKVQELMAQGMDEDDAWFEAMSQGKEIALQNDEFSTTTEDAERLAERMAAEADRVREDQEWFLNHPSA